jgi:serine/threonine-protein kinase
MIRLGMSQSTPATGPPDPNALIEVDGELMPGTVVGEYRVESKLGQGGMGSVYSAVQPVIGKRAAIKIMRRELCVDPVAVDRFVQEARAVNQIGHPNIVDVFSFGTLKDGRSYLAMEQLVGETLATRLKKGRLPLGEAIAILFQICDGLAAAHDKGIVHRDLKPENVFLVAVRKGRMLVKLLDFGVAKLGGSHGEGRVDHTEKGSRIGTPNYMSPEQAKGKEVDQRADIYSLGVTAYEMLLGHLPFTGDNAVEVLFQHINAQPKSMRDARPDLPPVLDLLVLAMMEKKPEDRPTLPRIESRLSELREEAVGRDTGPQAIRALESGTLPSLAASGARSVTSMIEVPRKRGPVIVAAVLAVALVIASLLVATRARTPAPPVVVATPAPIVAAPAPAAPAPAPTVATLATLVVHVDAPNAHLVLDGKPLGGGPRFTIAPGAHELTAGAPKRREVHRAITLVAGAVLELDVTLPALAVAAPAPAPKKSAPRPAHKGDRDFMIDPFGK